MSTSITRMFGAVAALGALAMGGTVGVTASPARVAKAPTAYVVNRDDTVTPINTATNKALKPIKIGSGLNTIAITRDGKTAYVTLGHAAHVAVVDVPTRKILGYILVGKRSWGLGMSRDEKTLYVANGFGDDVTVIDLKTRKATVSIPVGRIPWGVVIDD